jgi:hypothetical protein
MANYLHSAKIKARTDRQQEQPYRDEAIFYCGDSE